RQFEEAQSSGTNPLLARLNQNSAERAHIAAVGHQLGSEGARAPQVIGDFVDLNNSANWSSGSGSSYLPVNNGSTLNEAFDNIILGGDDDEFNELDADDDGGDDDTMNFAQKLNLHGDNRSKGSRDTMSAGAISAASAVDPHKLIGANIEGDSPAAWDVLAGFEPTLGDDDDELDENDPALEELGLALAPKSKREKKKLHKKTSTPLYPPEVQRLLGMANNAYVNKDYEEAVKLYQQVIVDHRNVFQAWNIMGVIQEELGNTEKALQLYLVAAHLTPKDGALWKKLAVISKNCGYDQQALYCFSRAYRADKNDMDALWDRSIMYQILNESYKAIMGFQKILKVKQHYMPALEELVKIYSSLDQDHKRYQENMHQAMIDYEVAYLHYSSLPDRFANTAAGDPFDIIDNNDSSDPQYEPFGYSALNMLSELYIMFEEYEKPIKMIKVWSRRLQRRSHQTWWDDYKDDREFDTDPDDEELQASLGENRTRGLPIDLRVKLGICRLMLEEVKEAKAQFKYLWRCSVEDFPDLYEEIAELYVSKQMWKEGYNVIRAMLQFDEMDIPKIWIMAGECLRHMGQLKESKDFLEQAHRADPSSVDVSMVLAEVYEEMGNLPQALTLVNFVRQVNAEKQADAERRRREARMAKLNKSASKGNKSAGPSASTPTAFLDGSQQHDPKVRQIAPRPSSSSNYFVSASSWHLNSEAARSAMERITEASRSRAAAERYTSADRDRDIQLVKSIREQERAEKLAERESQSIELREVIEKFNKIDAIYQRIDQKEKERVWQSKREAVRMTREDRTQYIQGARELINVFKNNRGFFPREKNKPYTGVETRAWRYRRNVVDADSGLSEHARDMAERLARAMGIGQSAPIIDAEEELAAPPSQATAPTTYKDVSFHVWYLLMIRQAVYLTYEDRYSEAAELLMVMFSANVFYSVPRRRSGIMLVLLACAMWAKDQGAILNAGRWLTNFGGLRPLPFKIFQSTFTTGPRNQHRVFVWAQNITHKYLKRHITRMRRAVGKGTQRAMRKIRTLHRKQRTSTSRGPNRTFNTLPPTLNSPKKRLRTDGTNVTFDVPASYPWRKVNESLVPTNSISAADTLEGIESRLQNSILQRLNENSSASTQPTFDNNPGGSEESEEVTQSSSSNILHGTSQEESESSLVIKNRKRQLDLGDDGVSSEVETNGRQSQGDDEQSDINDEDDYDVNDELYKTEDEDEDDGEDAETEWENENSAFSRSRNKVFGSNGRGKGSAADNDDDDYDEDDEDNYDDEGDDNEGGSKRDGRSVKGGIANTSNGQKTGGDAYNPKRPRLYTKELYPQFHLHMIMFFGHILAQSRSHVGSATQFAECLDYAPHTPFIHLCLAIQFFNLAMQRTTQNRQVALAQGCLFLQNYYRLRRAGYGSLAFSEREKENKAKGLPPSQLIKPAFSIVGVQSETTNWKAQASKISADAVTSSPVQVSSFSGRPSSSQAVPTPTSSSSPSQQTEVPTQSSETSAVPASTTGPVGDTAPLTHCQQEAEYNMARGFHQLGQNQLAMIHYRRVLELPSWRQVIREQEAKKKEAEEMKKESRRKARIESRALVAEMRLKKAQEIRERKEVEHAQNKGQPREEREEGEEGEGEEEEEDDNEALDDDMMESSDDEGDNDGGEQNGGRNGNGGSSTRSQPSRIKISDDDDPTDLKREAAFNLAKIFIQSGAMGEAQLLMREYCTI
ncbi:transcription factor TFIIIC subunit tfc4, partial [Entomortierella beljakovae]